LKDWLFMLETPHVLGLRWVCDAVVLVILKKMDLNVSQNLFLISAFKIAGVGTALVLVGFVTTRRRNRSAERTASRAGQVRKGCRGTAFGRKSDRTTGISR
jgi:hypothetical protein